MTRETDSLDELAAQFELNTDRNDPDDIPAPIQRVMRHIDASTGLLGDYNTGLVRLTETGHTIQWYSRANCFSNHNNLLHWLQKPEQDDVLLAHICVRQHPETGEKVPYAEIHETSRWVSDDE